MTAYNGVVTFKGCSKISVYLDNYKNMAQAKERGKNKQLVINMTASLVAFIVGLGVRFLLTPYIVESLGAEAYGFIGLSMNILSYTSLVTIALNSMSSRFITISYVERNFKKTNQYFSSVFYSNLILAVLILILGLVLVLFLEEVVKIPSYLVVDVKVLFLLLLINSTITLIMEVWRVAIFVKNRLDLSNIRNIVGHILNASVLLFLFSFFSPHIWYMGIAGIILGIYTSIANYRIGKEIAPELSIKKTYFDISKVFELIKAGSWNVLNMLGEILGQDLDLVIANICIGAAAMGIFSITRNIPFMILGLFQMLAGTFAPILTRLYAEKKNEELLAELKKTIRILGFFTTFPLASLFLLGEDFYRLWLPSQDASLLQNLTIIGGLISMVFAMPLEALWNIFTITNKLKYSTYVVLANNVLVFLTVLCSMFIVEEATVKLFILAGARVFWGSLRALIFLPLYGAYCLGVSKTTFYPPILKSVLSLIIVLVVGEFIVSISQTNTWIWFIFNVFVICLLTAVMNCFIVLERQDIQYLKVKLLKL